MNQEVFLENVNSSIEKGDGYAEVLKVWQLELLIASDKIKDLKQLNLSYSKYQEDFSEIAATLTKRAEEFHLERIYVKDIVDFSDCLYFLWESNILRNVVELDLSYSSNIPYTIGNICLNNKSLNIKILKLNATDCHDGTLMAISNCDTFSKLEELYLNENGGVTDEGIQSLKNSKIWLRVLEVELTNITKQSMDLLLRSTRFSRLKQLYFNEVFDNQQEFPYERMFSFKNLNRIKKISFKSSFLTSEPLKKFLVNKSFSSLSHLNVSDLTIGDDVGPYFLRAPFRRSLKVLILNLNQISQKFLRKISKMPCFHKLHTLKISNCSEIRNISTLKHFNASTFKKISLKSITMNSFDLSGLLNKSLPQMERFILKTPNRDLNFTRAMTRLNSFSSKLLVLKLCDVKCSAEDMKILFSKVKFTTLRELYLGAMSAMGKDFLGNICSSQSFDSLITLNLDNNSKIVDEDLKCILVSPNFKALKEISLLDAKSVTKEFALSFFGRSNLKYLEIVLHYYKVLTLEDTFPEKAE